MLPSASVAVPVRVTAFTGSVMVWSGPAFTTGAWLAVVEEVNSSQLMFQAGVAVE
jgi:hypothetical protein